MEGYVGLMKLLKQLSGIKKVLDKNINALIPQLNSAILPVEEDGVFEKEIEIEDKIYRVVMRHLTTQDAGDYDNVKDQGVIYATYFFDVTKETELQQANEESKNHGRVTLY